LCISPCRKLFKTEGFEGVSRNPWKGASRSEAKAMRRTTLAIFIDWLINSNKKLRNSELCGGSMPTLFFCNLHPARRVDNQPIDGASKVGLYAMLSGHRDEFFYTFFLDSDSQDRLVAVSNFCLRNQLGDGDSFGQNRN